MAARNQRHFVCVGFSAWRRRVAAPFLESPHGELAFVSDPAAAPSSGTTTFVVWGGTTPEPVRAVADRTGAPVVRMEDGFLRSVGLGVDLEAPASLVVDGSGIYFDPSRPSDLETILETASFGDEERGRARTLRERIVAEGISKYNVGGAQRLPPEVRAASPVVLVVGQVEDDASIRLGCPGVRRNRDLLAEARAKRPEAFILYKPHPDVVSGNRDGEVPAEILRECANHVTTDATVADCLRISTEVQTMTSLIGFEALLRGLRVVVYGQPFYAGWGLTEDLHPHPRRTRRLGLDELVAGTLLRYPRYVSATTGRFTTPEVVLDQLAAARAQRRTAIPVGASWLTRRLRKARNLWRVFVHAP
jgi:capsular polysaccharide export protein